MGFQLYTICLARRFVEAIRRSFYFCHPCKARRLGALAFPDLVLLVFLTLIAPMTPLVQVAHGQRAGLDAPSRFMERIDAEEGAQRIADFRRQRLRGDYRFDFELEHKPRQEPTVRYSGTLWGSWNKKGPISRIRVESAVESHGSGTGFVELIVQNGPNPEAWIRREAGTLFHPVGGATLFEPILPGVLYTPFDLQMPFIYWEDYVYEGPSRVGVSRVAHQFLMLPPEDFKNGAENAARAIKGVRLGLDGDYNVLLRIDIIDTKSQITSRFAVEGFRKVDDQYIIKRITLTNYPSKDRTTFDIKEASVGLSLGGLMFNPEH